MKPPKQRSLFTGPQVATKSKAQRAKRKGTKAGGESPCTACKTVSIKVKRDRMGRFK